MLLYKEIRLCLLVHGLGEASIKATERSVKENSSIKIAQIILVATLIAIRAQVLIAVYTFSKAHIRRRDLIINLDEHHGILGKMETGTSGDSIISNLQIAITLLRKAGYRFGLRRSVVL